MSVVRTLPYVVRMRPGADGWYLDIGDREYGRIARVPLPCKLTATQLGALAFDGEIDGADGGDQYVWLYDEGCTPDTPTLWAVYVERLQRLARLPIDYARPVDSGPPMGDND